MADRNKDLDNNSGASAGSAAASHAAQVAALGHGRRTAADGADAAAGAHAGAAQLRPASDALASSPAETQGAKTKEVSSVTTSVKQEQQSAAAAVLTPIHGNGISKEKVSSTSSSSVSDPRASDPVNISNSAVDSPVKPQKKKKSSVSALIARFEESQSSENLSEPDQQKSTGSGERSKVPLRSTRSVTPDKILSDLGDESQVAPRPKSAVDHSVVNHRDQNHEQELPLGAEALAVSNSEEPSERDQEATHEYLEGLQEEGIDIDEMTRRNGAYTSYVLIGASAPNNDLETASIHSSGSSGGSSANRVIVNVNKGVVLQDGRASNISIVSTESSDLGSGSPPAEGVDPNLFELVPDIPAKIRARNGVVDPSLGPDMQYFVAREPSRQDFGQRSRGGGGDPDEYLDDPSMTNYYTNAIEGSSGPSSGGSRRGRPPVVRAADRSLRRQQMFHEEIGEGEIMVEYDEYHPHPDQVEGGVLPPGGHPENFHITEVGPNGEHYEVYTDEMLDPDDEYDVRYESEEHSGDEQYVDNLQDYPMCQPVQYDSEEYISEGDEYFDREEELRGYNRQIDFTLHTILEESCEDSDANSSEQEAKRQGATGGTGEQKRSKRHSDPSEMEKYFLYGVGGGNAEDHDEEYYTTTGSSSPDEVLEDDLEAMHVPHGLVNGNVQPSYDAENILLNEEEEGEQGPQSMMSDRQNTDDSGSVGSESDGARTPEHQAAKIIKKKAVRGLHKGQSRSSDNGSQSDEDQDQYDPGSMKRNVNKKGRRGSASDAEVKKHLNNSETAENTANKVTNNHGSPSNSQSSFSPKGSPPITPLPSQIIEVQPIHGPSSSVTDPASAEDKSPKSISPVHHHGPGTVNAIRKHKSRDSGFVGSMDDLLRNEVASNGHHVNHSSDSSQSISDECENNTALKSASGLTGMTTGMSRLEKVSEVSGEDDNTLTDQANDTITHQLTRKDSFTWSSDEDTNIMMNRMRAFFRQIITTSAPSSVSNEKPPQLVAFEAKLTRMMKTVPGINEDQVKEIVEYLSSEDTWSDSYDSSDYTSSDIDLEVYGINVNNIKDEDLIEQENLQRETALMYSKLMAKMHEDNQQNSQLNKSPPIAAQVMAHISSKLVALMHESESEVEQPTTPTASSRFVFSINLYLV